MKLKLAAFLLPVVLPCLVCHGEQLTKITSSNFNGATASFAGQDIVVDNMRIASATTKPTDYIRGTFQFSNSTANFISTNFEVFQNVGVFNQEEFDSFFVYNSSNAIVLKGVAGGLYGENQSYSVSTGSAPFTASLRVGQVLSFTFSNFSDEVHFVVKAPDNSILFDDYFVGSGGVITGAIPILQTGQYTVNFTPLGKTPVSFMMSFGNANRQTLTTVTDGSYLETDFRQNLRDYDKYQVYLNAGDQLLVDQPDSNDIRLALLDSTSAFKGDNIGLPLLYVPSKAGYYYLFVSDSRAYGTNYSGYVHITKAAKSPAAEDMAAAADHPNLHSTPAKPRE